MIKIIIECETSEEAWAHLRALVIQGRPVIPPAPVNEPLPPMVFCGICSDYKLCEDKGFCIKGE